MKHPVYSPARGEPTDGEIAQFHQTQDHEAATVKGQLLGAIGTLGAPAVWGTVLKVAAPVALDAAAGIVKGLHPDSPGGVRLTKNELRAIARRAAEHFEEALFGAFLDQVAGDDPEPRPRAELQKGPAPKGPKLRGGKNVTATADHPITPEEAASLTGTLIDPAEIEGKTATVAEVIGG